MARADRADTALIILDIFSDFEFDDGARVARGARALARRLLRFKERATAAGIPTLYVNDDPARWRSEFSEIVRRCLRSKRGAKIAQLLSPGPEDYCIVKPKHSGFFGTALDTILDELGAGRLILTGLSSNQCVLFTANDAYVRDYQLWIPRDCISARTAAETRFALAYFRSVLNADLSPSSRRLPARHSRRSRRPS